MELEQRLMMQLILKSQCSWDERAIQRMIQFIGAKSMIMEDIPWKQAIQSTFPMICVGCGSSHGKIEGYPHVLSHCPTCTEKKLSPLVYKGQFLWAGEAKVHYIEQAFLFANDHTRDYLINQVLTQEVVS